MGNDLITTDLTYADPYLPPALTTSLAALVEDEALWAERRDTLPLLSAADRASAEAALAVFAAMPKGTPPDRISKLIGSISWMPARDGGAEQAKMQLAVYKTTLADIDNDVLAAAIREAVKTLTFFPTVAELRAIAARLPAPPRIVQAYRLRQLLKVQPVEEVELATPEEVRQILAEIGLPSVRAGAAPAERGRPCPAPEPTLDDYLGLGLSDEEARQALADRKRLLSRERAQPIASAA